MTAASPEGTRIVPAAPSSASRRWPAPRWSVWPRCHMYIAAARHHRCGIRVEHGRGVHHRRVDEAEIVVGIVAEMGEPVLMPRSASSLSAMKSSHAGRNLTHRVTALPIQSHRRAQLGAARAAAGAAHPSASAKVRNIAVFQPVMKSRAALPSACRLVISLDRKPIIAFDGRREGKPERNVRADRAGRGSAGNRTSTSARRSLRDASK